MLSGQGLGAAPVALDHGNDSIPWEWLAFLATAILAIVVGGWGLVFTFTAIREALTHLMTTVSSTADWLATGIAGLVLTLVGGLTIGILSEIGGKVLMKRFGLAGTSDVVTSVSQANQTAVPSVELEATRSGVAEVAVGVFRTAGSDFQTSTLSNIQPSPPNGAVASQQASKAPGSDRLRLSNARPRFE